MMKNAGEYITPAALTEKQFGTRFTHCLPGQPNQKHQVSWLV
jgi:hypothetical protein